MGDPERLLGTASGSDELERELLGSLRNVAPRAGVKDETWNRLAVQLAAAATVSATGAAAHAVASSAAAGGATQAATGSAATSAVTAATKWLTAKIIVSVVVASGAMTGGAVWIHERSAAKFESASLPASTTTPAPPSETVHAANPAEVPSSLSVVTEEPTLPKAPLVKNERVNRSADVAHKGDLLAIESHMLTDARAKLQAGDARGALATLERLKSRSPKGVLMQERDVLAIQAWSSLGDAETAKRKAKEFLSAYPESPHAPQIRRLAGDP